MPGTAKAAFLRCLASTWLRATCWTWPFRPPNRMKTAAGAESPCRLDHGRKKNAGVTPRISKATGGAGMNGSATLALTDQRSVRAAAFLGPADVENKGLSKVSQTRRPLPLRPWSGLPHKVWASKRPFGPSPIASAASSGSCCTKALPTGNREPAAGTLRSSGNAPGNSSETCAGSAIKC